jgi:spore maturation protein CgeB
MFIPFNHGIYLDPNLYIDAVKLDRLYQSRDPRLLRMYADLGMMIHDRSADAIIVDNCPPYHPDHLRKLAVYKVLYSGDDPGSTYMRNIPYLHAYDHVFFADPVYSPDMDMREKMRYCGMVNADWLPISVFDFECDPERTEETILQSERDIDIIYIGGFWKQKNDLLVKVQRAFGRRFKQFGFYDVKHNAYMNVRYGYGKWVRPVSFEERVKLYQRAKIGFNIHWNEYGLGNQRLYHLPANGVMQICDCPKHVDRIYRTGEEIVTYSGADDLIDKITYYLGHDEERKRIALQGYRRAMKEYRTAQVKQRAAQLIRAGMERISWKRSES